METLIKRANLGGQVGGWVLGWVGSCPRCWDMPANICVCFLRAVNVKSYCATLGIDSPITRQLWVLSAASWLVVTGSRFCV